MFVPSGTMLRMATHSATGRLRSVNAYTRRAENAATDELVVLTDTSDAYQLRR